MAFAIHLPKICYIGKSVFSSSAGQPSLGLPELFFARDLPGFGKSCPARFVLGNERSPCPSQCGAPNLEGLDVKASTVTKPRDRANWQWLSGGCILKPQGWGVGLSLESLTVSYC